MSRELPLTRIDLSLLLDGEGKCRMCGRSPPTGHAVECPAQFVENARCVLDYCQFGDSGASDVEGTFSAPLHSPGDLFRDAADFVVRYGGLTWIGFRVESSVPSTLSDEEIRAAIDREFPAAEIVNRRYKSLARTAVDPGLLGRLDRAFGDRFYEALAAGPVRDGKRYLNEWVRY